MDKRFLPRYNFYGQLTTKQTFHKLIFRFSLSNTGKCSLGDLEIGSLFAIWGIKKEVNDYSFGK